MVGWGPRAGARSIPTYSGSGGERSVRAGAARPEGVAEPPGPHTTWPRGGRPAATISRCEVRRQPGRGEGTRAGLDGADAPCIFSEDHVSALLDLRGDVSREQRLAALSSLQVGPQPSPQAGRRALFSLVPTPAPPLSSCLPSGSCA